MGFDLDDFRVLFPQFDDVDSDVITAVAKQAKCYLPSACAGDCLNQLLMLMVAHLLAMRAKIATGGGLAIASATEGNVSVTLVQPADMSARAQWLNGTPYGQQYMALFNKCVSGKAAAGLYFGDLPEQRAFRRVGGVFK